MTLAGSDAVHHCLETGVRFNPIEVHGHMIRKHEEWWFECPRCFQPFTSTGFPVVICTECWYEGSAEKPLISLGIRKRLKRATWPRVTR